MIAQLWKILSGTSFALDALRVRLKAHGFDAHTLADAVRRYQEWHGLALTGEADADTLAHLDAPRFCRHPDHPGLSLGRTWNKRALTYRILGLPTGMTTDHVARTTAALSEATPLTFTRITSGTADITLTAGWIDGPGGTLAWSQLPDGNDSPLTQKYDTSEQWPSIAFLVTLHEWCHALGMDHQSRGLMRPTLDTSLSGLDAFTVQVLQGMYGTPRPVPTPTPIPPPADRWTITLGGSGAIEAVSIPGFRVTRIEP